MAQGRVWSGRHAPERGLVDRVGTLGDAVQAAAHRGKLAAGHRVQCMEAEPGRLQRLMQGLGATVATLAGSPVDLQGAEVALGLISPLAARRWPTAWRKTWAGWPRWHNGASRLQH